jgi:hypothetical protein
MATLTSFPLVTGVEVAVAAAGAQAANKTAREITVKNNLVFISMSFFNKYDIYHNNIIISRFHFFA